MVRSLVGSYRPPRAPVVVPDVEQKDSVSIVSMPKDRSERIRMIDGWKDTRKKKNGDMSCADSILSDISFNPAPPVVSKGEISGSFSGKGFTHEFLIECENGERIYVPRLQGMAIKSRCQHFRSALDSKNSNVVWGGSDSESVTSKAPEQRIVSMQNWSTGTARHIIELLSEGVTWIENDQERFVELLKACDEVNARLYLGSPINYHDILDRGSSLRFFQLLDEEKYRFQLVGTIKSNQWMALIQKGILLDLDSSLLMLSSESSSQKGEDTKKVQGRLSKCDDLYSEYNVYSKRSMVNSLYTILSVLCINDSKSSSGDKGNKSTRVKNDGESIQVVCKTMPGALSERDWNTFWRMTSTSFTVSTPEEERLLQSKGTNTDGTPPGNIRIKKNSSSDSSSTGTLTTANTTMLESMEGDSNDSDDASQESSPIYSLPSNLKSPAPSKLESKLSRGSQQSVKTKTRIKYETRTITGTSFVAVKHLFHPVNRLRQKKASSSNRDFSQLPACLSISNPTPDTLGRFLNACASIPGKNSGGDTATKIGYDILPPSSFTNSKNGIMFFVTDTTHRVKEILNYMADYGGASEVGEADFRLEQLRHS